VTATPREFDIVLFGATGFVGKLTAEYLARAGSGARIALAGRSPDRLAAVREGLGESARSWPVLSADATSPSTLEEMAARTQVVVTTVGPYTRYGLPLVAACAAAGTPLLGVCLGHQAIGVAFGAAVDRAPELLHGKTSDIFHTNVGVLQGLPDPFTATRYHSLTILPESLPAVLEVTARTRSDVIMGVRHTELPIHGVQFHPESILTEGGHLMLANWLSYCGWARNDTLVRRLENEVRAAVRPHYPADPPVTDRTSA